MGMMQEFREFALKGNVVDLAVGVIIGAAFGKIVDSLVKDVVMPVLGLVTGRLDFSQKFFVLGTISVFLNTAVDVVVTYAASAVRDRLAARPAIIRRMRQTSGGILCALGVTLAMAKRPA